MESSSANEIEENLLYDEMMLSLLRIVTEPLRNVLPPRVPPAAVGQTEIYTEAPPSSEDNHSDPMIPMIKGEHGFWMQVHGPSPVTFGTKDLWKNLLNWRAFTHKNRLKVLV